MEDYKNFSIKIEVFSNAIKAMGICAKDASVAFQNFSKALNKLIPKEYKIMQMKLILMEARLNTLNGRNTECEAIRKKLRRQIRNLKAKMAETPIAQQIQWISRKVVNRVENKRHTTLLCPHNKVGIIPCGYAKIDTYAGVAQSAERRPSKAEAGGSLPLSRSIKSVRVGSKSGML